MSKKTVVNPSFVKFCEWYKENRPRFKVSWRKSWDDIVEWVNVPGDFKFSVVTNDEFSKVDIAYSRRNGRYSMSVGIGFNRHYYFKGVRVLEELAILAENGRINEMGNPDLNEALLLLTRFRKDPDQLTLRTTHDVDGKLIYVNATNGTGLMRVMLSLEDKDRD